MDWIEQQHFLARLEALLDDERCPYDLTVTLLRSEVQRAREAMSRTRDNALLVKPNAAPYDEDGDRVLA